MLIRKDEWWWGRSESSFLLFTMFNSDVSHSQDGVISFTFFWSIPNRIPLHPDDILSIWRQVKLLEFHTAFGAFKGQDVRTRPNEKARGTGGIKGRLLESCKIYIKAMGWDSHALLEETL